MNIKKKCSGFREIAAISPITWRKGKLKQKLRDKFTIYDKE